MNKYLKLKLLINAILLLTLLVLMSISLYFIRDNIKSHALDSSISEAKHMTSQLLITRSYLASVAHKVKVVDENLAPFALAPAYVGAHIGKEMNKKYEFYIKQTSIKYRNKNNIPDKYETKILQKYENNDIKGPYWEVSNMNNNKVLRYTTPLYIKPDCLACHGKPYVDVNKQRYNQLVSIYGNRSFNYKNGDLRGVISIAIPIDSVYIQSDYIFKNFSILISLFFIVIILYIVIEKIYIFKPQLEDIQNKEIYKETVIESNNNAIIAIDGSGKITTYNTQAEKIFGWSKKEMLGTREVLRIIPDKYKSAHLKASMEFLKTGISSGVMGKSHELEAIRKNGEVFPIKISIGSKHIPKNVIVVANISDISKEKDQELLLNQQSKMVAMGEMIGNIAHQWRQPLSIISTASTGMKMQKEYNILTDEEFATSCDAINDNAQYLSKTIDDFKNFIKGDRTKNIFNLEDDINSFLHLVEGSIKNNNINMILNIDSSISIDGYQNELIQCLINIYNNAKDILKENKIKNKLIFISTFIQNNQAVTQITDNAGGIPEDIISKIFEPYFTTKHQSQGTGLGLHMTYNLIVDGMGGTIEASNKTYKHENIEYTGAEFKISLPMS